MSPPLQIVVSDEKLPTSAEIVVIGAGIAGSTAAYWLAKKGHKVALLDKGVIGGEQTSRNWGWCRQQHRDLRELPLAMKSLEIWGDLSRELGAETGFRRTGLLYVTTRPDDFAQWEAWTLKAREYQMHSRVLSGAEARELTPGSTGDWIGGVHSPTDGAVAGRSRDRGSGAQAGGHAPPELCGARPRHHQRQGFRRHHGAWRDRHTDRAAGGRCLEFPLLSPARSAARAGQRALYLLRHDRGAGSDGWRPFHA